MQAQAIVTVTNNPVNSTIESLHSEMRSQFTEMYMSQRSTLAQLQAQQKAERIERIKNVLFADLLCKIIKQNSEAGHETPAEIDLQTLLEVI